MAKEYEEIPGVCNCPECHRPPIIVKTGKIRGGSWRVACPYLDCENVSSYGGTEREAIEKWNKGEVVKA